MSNDGWNIHGWIAVPLEAMAREVIGLDEKEIQKTFLSADAIEAGTFVEVMFFLLRQGNGINENYNAFAQEAQVMFAKPLTIADKETIILLFKKFKALYDCMKYKEPEENI